MLLIFISLRINEIEAILDTFLSLSDFPKIQTLFLDSCTFSRFPLIFTHLHSLTLMCCRGFTVLPGFPSLNSLEINTCSKLTELHLCGSGEKKHSTASYSLVQYQLFFSSVKFSS
jgi:hypothetical protein